MSRLIPRLLILCIAAAPILAACGSSGGAEESPPSNATVSVSSGTFTTTVRVDGATQLPFSETLVIEAAFEEPIYGSAGQTSVFAQASPSAYRVGPRPQRDDRTFVFSLTNRTPGTVEVSIFANRDAKPLVFTLEVGGR
jgi:hypothetical protein